jgi:hypothetical protein
VPEDVKKSTLITKFGLYDWIVMPFGMKNATSTFTCTMTEIFGAYMDRFLKVFVDDLNIHILTWDEHLEHIRFVLMKLKEVNFKLNPDKCEFAKTNICFLGHTVNRKGTQPDQQKFKIVIEFPILMLVTNVHAFLGINGYYMNYVKG